MNNYAILRNEQEYTIFEYNDQSIRFMTSSRLERYTKILEWDHGYLVVMAKYKGLDEIEEYIDLIPILQNLYYDAEKFLSPIKEVKLEYDNIRNPVLCEEKHDPIKKTLAETLRKVLRL